MCSTAHAIRSLTKANATITTKGNRVEGRIGNHVVDFIDQDGLIVCLRTRRITDVDSSHEDYSAGSWADSIKQAIRWAVEWTARDISEVASGHMQAHRVGLA